LPEPALQPDFYVMALNIEQSRRLVEGLISDDSWKKWLEKTGADGKVVLAKTAPDFTALLSFGPTVDDKRAMHDMTGIQYFFDAKTDIGRGHLYFPFSRWGLSSITQTEFWSARGGFADGYFGLLSVDVCTTGEPPVGTVGPPSDAK